MAKILPTYDDFVTRFPEFENVEEDAVNFALADGADHVGSFWYDDDWHLGILLYAAHVLAVAPANQFSEATASGDTPLKGITIGPIRLDYATPTNTASVSTELASTMYGKRFEELRRRNSPGIMVI